MTTIKYWKPIDSVTSKFIIQEGPNTRKYFRMQIGKNTYWFNEVGERLSHEISIELDEQFVDMAVNRVARKRLKDLGEIE